MLTQPGSGPSLLLAGWCPGIVGDVFLVYYMAFPHKAVHLVYDYWIQVHNVESTGAEMQQEVSIYVQL